MKPIELPQYELPKPVVAPGEFLFATVGLEHAHAWGQTRKLIEAGGTFAAVYDPDPALVQKFLRAFPETKIAASLDEILDDERIRLVTSAPVPSERAALGAKVLRAGKDYFVDKAPMTTLEQVATLRRIVAETGRKYIGYYSERVGSEAGIYTERLLREGLIGDFVQLIGLGPHRLSAPIRPAWFFEKEKYGGILVDIGSHQTDQFLTFAGSKNAQVVHAAVDNVANATYPELEDFGEANLVDEEGRRAYMRVDWFTPDALPAFGDGRTIIIGTKGTIETRKYVDLGNSETERIYVVNNDGAAMTSVKGKVGFPFFGKLILDCLNRTENAMTQEHSFAAIELAIQAQLQADKQRAATPRSRQACLV